MFCQMLHQTISSKFSGIASSNISTRVVMVRVFLVHGVHAGHIEKYDTLLGIVENMKVSYSYDM